MAPNFKNSLTSHNAILVIGEVKLYVIKEVLMVSSSYFADLFSQNTTESSPVTIELENVKLDDFIEFLNQLYNVGPDIKNFLIVLTMAQKYDSKRLLSKCEEFLRYIPNMKMLEHDVFVVLEFSIKHKVEDIKHCLSHLFCCEITAPCKNCKNIGSCDSPDECTKLKGLYLPNDHICIKYKEEMMKLEPEIVAFILDSLLDSYYANVNSSISSRSSASVVSSESESTDTDDKSESESTEESGSHENLNEKFEQILSPDVIAENTDRLNDIVERLSVVEKHLTMNQNIDETTTGNELNSGKRSNTNELIEVEKKKPREMVKHTKATKKWSL